MNQPENPSAENELVQQRIAKLDRLRAGGIDPYPPRFGRSHTATDVHQLMADPDGEGTNASVGGRIVAIRGMGRLTFAVLRDGSGEVQVSFRRDELGDDTYALLKELDLGDFVGVQGLLYRTRTDEDTVQAASFTVLAKAVRPPPEKWHGLRDVEQRYRQRYLDLIANAEVRDIFQKRSKTVSAVRTFMDQRGFLEVETPMLLPLAAGAMARPFETEHHALSRHLFLRIATELHLKRLVVGGFERVYEIGRIFRNEGIDASHNPEFTTMESYQAYADYRDVMEMVEQMVSSVAEQVTGSMVVPGGEGPDINLTPPWTRLSLLDAVRKWSEGIDLLDDRYRTVDGLRTAMHERGLTPASGTSWPQLADKLISDLVEPRLIQPTFLTDYPVEMTPLAKAVPGEARLVERFEAFVRGTEIANSFTELNDPVEQRARLEAQEEARREFGADDFDRLDEDFLVAMEHGMPPTGGLGIGIDRLVMLLTAQTNIREVVLFPLLRSLE